MDSGNGTFKIIDENVFSQQMQEENPMVFREGEVIEVRGSRLRVEKIYKKKITFKLLPQLK
jgi:hypothetical protein